MVPQWMAARVRVGCFEEVQAQGGAAIAIGGLEVALAWADLLQGEGCRHKKKGVQQEEEGGENEGAAHKRCGVVACA